MLVFYPAKYRCGTICTVGFYRVLAFAKVPDNYGYQQLWYVYDQKSQ